MTETSGGSYKRTAMTWTTATGTPTFTVPTSAPAKPFPRCTAPDAAMSGEWEWTCPDCGTVWNKHADYWWEPEETP